MPNPGTITWHATTLNVLRRRSGRQGLRLPRAHARVEERQEDRALRRRDPDLPPLLRQRDGRPEHDPHELPLPAGRLDGQARDQPAADDPAVGPGRLARLLGGPAGPGRGSRPGRSSGSARRGWSSPTRAASRTRWSASTSTSARRRTAATCPASTRSAARSAPRRQCASPSRWTSSCARRSTRRWWPPRAQPSVRIGTDEGDGRRLELVGSPTGRRARGSSARARSITTRSTPAPRRTRRGSRTTSSGSGSPTCPTSRTAATSSRSTAHPGGALFEFAYAPGELQIDEAADELGTHMCIPPHWEDRRSEISQLESIDTVETVV